MSVTPEIPRRAKPTNQRGEAAQFGYSGVETR